MRSGLCFELRDPFRANRLDGLPEGFDGVGEPGEYPDHLTIKTFLHSDRMVRGQRAVGRLRCWSGGPYQVTRALCDQGDPRCWMKEAR